MEPHSFGYWLRLKRKALDLTRDDLAALASCSAATIRKLEAEERRPSQQIAERLAVIFQIPFQEQAAFLRFARGEWGSAPAQEVEDFPWRTASKTPRSNLPAQVTTLIGRDLDLVQIHELLLRSEIRLVTLIGPPGVGKTRLAIESARLAFSDFPDGVFFVPLAPLDVPSLIPFSAMQALEYRERGKLPVERQLVEGIRDKQMLIVLDNCEHLIGEVAEFAAGLLSACPRLRILATSRESLRIHGEWLYAVSSLEYPQATPSDSMEAISKYPAVVLFEERARAVLSDFELEANNIQSVCSICVLLDGLPLAIELIAARIRLMSPQALMGQLNDQVILHSNGRRAISQRQKSLHDAIAWSYNLLSEEERELFARLSVFSGGFTLNAAISIFSRTTSDKSIPDLITSLFDKSLLQCAKESRTIDEQRFNMLVTIQQFARQRLHQLGEEADVRNKHLAYFLDLAETADQEIHGPCQVEWMDRLDNEIDNLRVALEWCVIEQNTEVALRLLGALAWIWGVRYRDNDLFGWFEKIRTLPDVDRYPVYYARLLNHIGRFNWRTNSIQVARPVLDESQAIWQKLGTDGERGLAEVLGLQGMYALINDIGYKTAQSYFESSLELAQKHNYSWVMAYALSGLGLIAMDNAEDAQALTRIEQSLMISQQLGDILDLTKAYDYLAQLSLKLRNFEKARFYIDQELRSAENLKSIRGIIVSFANLGDFYRYQHDYVQAEWSFAKCQDLIHQFGDIDGYILYYMGILALQQNNYDLASQRFSDFFEIARNFSGDRWASDFIAGMSAVAAGTRQFERAAKLHGAAKKILKIQDDHILPFDRAELERHIQMAREQLGETVFEVYAAEGRVMSVEQAISHALEQATWVS